VLCVEDGHPQAKASDMMTDHGLIYLVDRVRKFLMAKYKTGELSEQLVKKSIDRGYFIKTGRRLDLKPIIAPIVKDWAEFLFASLKGRVGNFLEASERLIVAGGSAYHLKQELEKRFPDFAVFPDRAEFANARGYLSVLQRRG
jgi:hypothetical protein